MANIYQQANDKSYVDYDGLVYLLGLLNNYPTNELLSAVIDGIQDLIDGSLNTMEIVDDNNGNVALQERS